MLIVRWRLLLLLMVILAVPAKAADVAYPTGSRIGLTPPPGLALSKSFAGFEDRANRVAMVIAALPPAAFAEIEKSAGDELLKKQGITIEARDPVAYAAGKGFLVVGRQKIGSQIVRKWILVLSASDLTALITVQVPVTAQANYPDVAIRTALASLSVRDTIPTEEQLGLLPFRVKELAGFNVGGVVAGRALILTDGAANQPVTITDTHIVVAVAIGGPSQASDRGRFAHEVFDAVPNLKNVRITSSEGLRIGGQQGHQIMATGRDGASGDEIKMVQWLRFGGGAYLHLIGMARSDGWIDAYARFRQVRDGIAMR
jgi:hypothetical protein